MELETFLTICKAQGVHPISKEDPIWDFAEKVGIPSEWIELAWKQFLVRYRAQRKKYVDWRAAFRNCVRDNWFGIWWMNEEGELLMTSKGRTIQKALEQ